MFGKSTAGKCDTKDFADQDVESETVPPPYTDTLVRTVPKTTRQLNSAIQARDDVVATGSNLQREYFKAVSDGGRALSDRKRAISDRDKAITDRDRALYHYYKAIVDRDKAISNHRDALSKYHKVTAERDKALSDRKQALSDRDMALSSRNRALSIRDKALADRDKAILDRGKAFLDHDKTSSSCRKFLFAGLKHAFLDRNRTRDNGQVLDSDKVSKESDSALSDTVKAVLGYGNKTIPHLDNEALLDDDDKITCEHNDETLLSDDDNTASEPNDETPMVRNGKAHSDHDIRDTANRNTNAVLHCNDKTPQHLDGTVSRNCKPFSICKEVRSSQGWGFDDRSQALSQHENAFNICKAFFDKCKGFYDGNINLASQNNRTLSVHNHKSSSEQNKERVPDCDITISNHEFIAYLSDDRAFVDHCKVLLDRDRAFFDTCEAFLEPFSSRWDTDSKMFFRDSKHDFDEYAAKLRRYNVIFNRCQECTRYNNEVYMRPILPGLGFTLMFGTFDQAHMTGMYPGLLRIIWSSITMRPICLKAPNNAAADQATDSSPINEAYDQAVSSINIIREPYTTKLRSRSG